MYSIIESCIRVLLGQQEKVRKSGKYPKPVHKSNYGLLGWIQHKKEEVADTLVYTVAEEETVLEVIDILHAAKDATSMQACHEKIELALTRLGG